MLLGGGYEDGFDYDNSRRFAPSFPLVLPAPNDPHASHHTLCRNDMLLKTGMKLPTATKTGTTICGVVYKVCILAVPRPLPLFPSSPLPRVPYRL